MKKLFALLLMVVMSITLLAGCSNPVYDDLENFLNVEMKEVNADYVKITTEVGTWESLPDDVALAKSINDTLLPLVDGSLTKLGDITPATEEVKELKEKYVKVMEAYKAGFEALAEGCKTQKDETINAGNESLGKAVDLLNEYNTDLEALAKEFGAEIEY